MFTSFHKFRLLVLHLSGSQDVGPAGRIPPKKQLVDLSCNLVSLWFALVLACTSTTAGFFSTRCIPFSIISYSPKKHGGKQFLAETPCFLRWTLKVADVFFPGCADVLSITCHGVRKSGVNLWDTERVTCWRHINWIFLGRVLVMKWNENKFDGFCIVVGHAHVHHVYASNTKIHWDTSNSVHWMEGFSH